MDPLRTYRVVHELSRAIHSGALRDVPRWALIRGAERLRMRGKRGVLAFDSEEETDVLAQFVLYEVLVGGTPTILRHLGMPSSTFPRSRMRIFSMPRALNSWARFTC